MLRALGQTLAKARERSGATQEEIAHLAEVNAQQPSRWENGERWPHDVDIAAYSEATKTSVADLWLDAVQRCINLALTQQAVDEAVRAERRTERLRKRSRRKPPASKSPPEGA